MMEFQIRYRLASTACKFLVFMLLCFSVENGLFPKKRTLSFVFIRTVAHLYRHLRSMIKYLYLLHSCPLKETAWASKAMVNQWTSWSFQKFSKMFNKLVCFVQKWLRESSIITFIVDQMCSRAFNYMKFISGNAQF